MKLPPIAPSIASISFQVSPLDSSDVNRRGHSVEEAAVVDDRHGGSVGTGFGDLRASFGKGVKSEIGDDLGVSSNLHSDGKEPEEVRSYLGSRCFLGSGIDESCCSREFPHKGS